MTQAVGDEPNDRPLAPTGPPGPARGRLPMKSSASGSTRRTGGHQPAITAMTSK